MSPPHIARYPIVIIAGRVTHEYATPIQRFAIRPETGRVCTVVPSARVAKLADAPDLGSGVHGRGGSSPPSRTTGIRAAPIGRSALVSGYADPATTSDDTFSALGIMDAPVDRYTSGYRSSSGPRGDTSMNPAVERRERCTPAVAGSATAPRGIGGRTSRPTQPCRSKPSAAPGAPAACGLPGGYLVSQASGRGGLLRPHSADERGRSAGPGRPQATG